jgi:diguanylate cyclase (GGDEF)-like protein
MLNRLLGGGELFRSGRVVLLMSIVVATSIGATAGLKIWHGRQSALEEHRRGMESMGVVLAEQTSRFVQVIDLIVQAEQSRVAGLNLATPAEFQSQLATSEVHLHLFEILKNVPQADAIGLVDADGVVVNGSRTWPAASIDLSDRDYYSYFKEHNDPGLFVGSLAKSHGTGTLSLFFARRINGPDGKFRGLVVALVDIRSLSAFYRAAGEHVKQAVTLLRRDGTMLIRYPDPETAIGVKLPPSSPWYDRLAESGGSYFTSGNLDGIPALVTVHPVTDYPLVVDVVMHETDIFARWRTETWYTAIVALAEALAFAGLFRILRRQFRQLSEAVILMNEGRQIFRSYAEMSADWFWEQDTNFRFKSESGIPFVSATNDTGKTRRDVAIPTMTEMRWIAHEADLAARRPFRDFRWERVGSDGQPHFISSNGDPVFGRNGTFTGYRGTGRDVTAEVEAAARVVQANAKLELGNQQFEAVLSNIMQGVCFFDGEKRLQVWNRRFAEIYNLKPSAFRVGCSLKETIDLRHAAGSTPDMTPADYLARQELLIAARQPAAFVLALMNGRFIDIFHHPMPGGGWVSTHEDITARHQAEASIMFMARHDTQTKLPNRVLFRERMEQAIMLAARGGQFATLCLDLDNFKQVNDTLGHPVGDGLLVAVADRLQACVREGDTVARLGGDEFAIIQLAVRQPDDGEALASRIIEAFLQPFDVDGHQIMSGVSIGVAVAPGDGVSYEELMRDADIALYLAKTEHRGAARFFEPEMDARIHLRRLLESDLQAAIAHGEFELFYQPQINLISRKISGFEALLRWHHPIRGFVSPLDFISVAEETGMIVAIGEWVLQTACFEAENWPADVNVAVNLSPVQFKKGDLVATVRRALTASGLPPSRLELEITESVFLGATADTMKALHDLRKMGISVALDDFGTGYSSLSYLRSFAFNKIKIDQSFVRDLMTSKESLSIVRAVTGLGQSLGMMTIAEGVETKEQLDRLREEGCTEVQGFFFSKPRSAGEVPAMLEELRTRT